MPRKFTRSNGVEVQEVRIGGVEVEEYERWKVAAGQEERAFAAWARFHLSAAADKILSDSLQHVEQGVSPPPQRPAFRPSGR